MRRKIFVLGAFVSMIFGFNTVNAQDFVKERVHIFAEDNPIGDRLVVHQGETKRLRGYIKVISDKEAGNYSKVKHALKDSDFIYEKLTNDLDKILDMEKLEGVTRSQDTLYIIADSIAVEKVAKYDDNGSVTNNKGIFLYYEGQKSHQVSSTYSNDLEDAIDNLGYALKRRLNNNNETSSCEHKKKYHRRVLESGFDISYGYLGWSTSNSSLFSTPSDDHSTKWSNKWDFTFVLNIYPDNRVWLSTGIGLQSNIFKFDDGFSLGDFSFNPPANSISKDKCKLVARYITVPLFMNVKVSEHVGIQAGVVGGLNYRNSHTGFKRNYKLDGEKIEQSTGSNFKEFNTFKLEANLGVKIYGITFYVSHALTPIFKDSYGKDLYPFAFGIKL